MTVRACLPTLLACTAALMAGCDRPPSHALASSTDADVVHWLDTGTGPGQTVYPRAIARDPAAGWVYLVDRQGRIQRLDRDGHVQAAWLLPDTRLGKPVGLSVGPDGLLYVPDTHYHRVLVYTPDGTELRRFGSYGTDPGQFIFPTDVAFHDGLIYVSEYGDNDRIQAFAPDGTWRLQFGRFGREPGEFSRPQSIAFIGGELFVADACNHRIQVFSPVGELRRILGGLGDAPGQFRFPYGLEATPDGQLLVTEFGNSRVQRLDPRTGRATAVFGRPGRGAGELAHPWAATADDHGRTIIVDSGNNRLVVVRF